MWARSPDADPVAGRNFERPPFDKGVNECSTGQWEAYRKANEIFTEAILSVYEDDDYVAWQTAAPS